MATRRNDGAAERAAYLGWIAELKRRYRATQIKAAVAVNATLLEFYWALGRDIAGRYPGKKRNAHFFENLSADLCLDVPNPKGLSPSNIRYSLRFFELYGYLQQVAEDKDGNRYLPQVVEDKGGNGCLPQVAADKGGNRYLQQVAANNAEARYRPQAADDKDVGELAKVPWGHHILLIGKCKGDREKAMFYVRRTVENRWSRSDLQEAIEDRLYEKAGKALTNFAETLPAPEGPLARELVRSEYSFALTETVDRNNERDVEAALVRNITRTLTELGGGFAYVGHQVRVVVGGEDFWPDLVFYHLRSRRYLVIELKAGSFRPEHVGQLGFYMEAVDRQIKNEWDAPTVGLVLCRDGNRTVVEYALSVVDRPMGVARYRLVQQPPKELAEMKAAVDRLGDVVDATLSETPGADAGTDARAVKK